MENDFFANFLSFYKNIFFEYFVIKKIMRTFVPKSIKPRENARNRKKSIDRRL